MTIDRNNYEMYFLLYVDNELSAAERDAVERFVAANADLKTELEILLETTLPASEIVFASKDDLYKNEWTAALVKERMLLYLDNELQPLPAISFEAEIASNDDLKREWNILQQTKLDANEKIVFEDKQVLYRHEKDKVITMRFRRLAAAAAIIGAGIFIGLSILTKKTDSSNVAVAHEPSTKKIIQPVKAGIPVKENTISEQQLAETLVATEQKNNKDASVKKNIVTNAGQTNTVAYKNDAEKEMAKKSAIRPKASFENINSQKSNETVSLTVQDNIKALQNKKGTVNPEKKDMAISRITELPISLADQELTETHNSYAKTAAINEKNSETDNNHFLFMDEEKMNHSKISGLFRKVKRVLSRNANIKTGSSVKIAGFEVAAR